MSFFDSQNVIQMCREMLSRGRKVKEILAFLREKNFTTLAAIGVLRNLGWELRDAKELAVTHKHFGTGYQAFIQSVELTSLALETLERCDTLATFSESPYTLTRLFLSSPMHDVHRTVRAWMEEAGMQVRVDAVGNIIGHYAGQTKSAKTLLIGSHLDTVKNAGQYDGMLGVLLGVALVKSLAGERLPYSIEVIGFSEEEGVRYSKPFFGSKAVIGRFDDTWLELRDANNISVAEVIRNFGLNPDDIPKAKLTGEYVGYLEFHIEQGPVLESLHLPLGIVETIVGQIRLELTFLGKANHAGTTPMNLRQDALAGAAEWMLLVEREAKNQVGLVATVGTISTLPGAGNVIPGEVKLSLDVRHADDSVRQKMVTYFLQQAERIAGSRNLTVSWEVRLEQNAVPCDAELVGRLERAVGESGYPVHRMTSGAGHDAMVLAEMMPAAMLFLRTPGGLSHHPDETVLEDDVAAALEVGVAFLKS
jgi:allantoate deiminase